MSANVLCTSKYIIYISAAIFCLDFLYGERQSAAFICSVLRKEISRQISFVLFCMESIVVGRGLLLRG